MSISTCGHIRTIDYANGELLLIDQTALPDTYRVLSFAEAEPIARAIETMIVRGAPAIGITAAFGIAIGVRKLRHRNLDSFLIACAEICGRFAKTRPTAVNLFWAIQQMKQVIESRAEADTIADIKKALEEKAIQLMDADIDINRRIGECGAELLGNEMTILTHCNAGALATVAYGTALSVFRFAHWAGKRIKIISSETRPRMQGAYLTAWEMLKEGIPVQQISDNMSAFFMAQGSIHMVIVGADRIAANGDTANKIGTLMHAVLAREFNIPFFIAAPISTFDFATPTGNDIAIEFRSTDEMCKIRGEAVYPEGVQMENPAFDVTPHKYITGYITENGIFSHPSELLTEMAFPIAKIATA